MSIQYARGGCECGRDVKIYSNHGHRSGAGFAWYAMDGDEAECVDCGQLFVVVVEENEGHAWLKPVEGDG